MIRLYQKTLSPDHGPFRDLFPYRVCKFHPTCSQYTYDAIGKYGLIKGSWIGWKRILDVYKRQHPVNNPLALAQQLQEYRARWQDNLNRPTHTYLPIHINRPEEK